jgi:NDP-sugar pyrophosphorylase family protein
MASPERGQTGDRDPVPVAILAGGLGTRLRAVTGDRVPKPLVEVAGRPFLEYLLDQVSAAGFRDVCLLTGHGAEAIRARIGDGERWHLRIGYSQETTPMGTGGALRLAVGQLAAPRLLVMNGDSFLDASPTRLVEAHAAMNDARGILATLALVRVADASRFGSVTLGPDGGVTAFREKGDALGPGLVSAGVYVIEREMIDIIPAGRPISLERDIWPRYCDGRLSGVEVEGAFADIGTPRSLAALRARPGPLVAASRRTADPVIRSPTGR